MQAQDMVPRLAFDTPFGVIVKNDSNRVGGTADSVPAKAKLDCIMLVVMAESMYRNVAHRVCAPLRV